MANSIKTDLILDLTLNAQDGICYMELDPGIPMHPEPVVDCRLVSGPSVSPHNHPLVTWKVKGGLYTGVTFGFCYHFNDIWRIRISSQSEPELTAEQILEGRNSCLTRMEMLSQI